MRSRTSVAIALALLGAAALSACSPAEAEAPEPTATGYVVEDAAAQATREAEAVAPELPDPCTLLSARDIADAVGLEFGAGLYNGFLSSETETICEWNASGEAYASVQLTLRATDRDLAAERAWAEEYYGPTVDVSVAGVDGAFSAQDGTVVGLLEDGMAVYVLHYTDAWEDLTAQTSAIAALVAAAL
ncbi:DUF3558 family protein [Demequina sp. NBRC 110052]|uniref:DUF3558 family protein n=1 Tax=Demequina sp. NBRC 110052 TaxID=1570341 RepID=UPI000A011771|nr:DUF3558 family protein [Demequina sp. NBRC 110052]